LSLKFEVTSLTLVPGRGGVFEVTVNGVGIWSKKATGKYPDPDRLLAEVKRLAAAPPGGG